MLFNFHLNGTGDCRNQCEWAWQDQGNFHAVYRDIVTPAKLVAYLSRPEDQHKLLVVHGFDDAGNKLRRQENGEWMDGYRVPTIFGYAIPDSGAPTVARITAVTKDITAGPVRLSTIDDSGTTGVLLAVYEPDERLPQYRRIKVNHTATWVRVAYIKTNPSFSSRFDHVPLKSRIGFLLALRACKYYQEVDLANAHAYEADAVRIEVEAQMKTEAPLFFPIQVLDRNNPQDKTDYDIR
jgi:hypothetical protein